MRREASCRTRGRPDADSYLRTVEYRNEYELL
eukprot:COSAG02_NODE_49283_length_327_cov_59.192982_1_plen_31_part_10